MAKEDRDLLGGYHDAWGNCDLYGGHHSTGKIFTVNAAGRFNTQGQELSRQKGGEILKGLKNGMAD